MIPGAIVFLLMLLAALIGYGIGNMVGESEHKKDAADIEIYLTMKDYGLESTVRYKNQIPFPLTPTHTKKVLDVLSFESPSDSPLSAKITTARMENKN
jgi:hypothetical protein